MGIHQEQLEHGCHNNPLTGYPPTQQGQPGGPYRLALRYAGFSGVIVIPERSTPERFSGEMDFVDAAAFEALTVERDGLVVERDRYRDALAEAVRVIEGLAEQQAMPDDWYEVPLARLKELVALGDGETP